MVKKTKSTNQLNTKNLNTFQKLLIRDTQWTERTWSGYQSDGIHWLRQVFSLIIGLIWGILEMKGIFGLIGYALVITALIYVYHRYWCGFSDDHFDENDWEMSDILKEGMQQGFGVFLLFWVTSYTVFHFG